MNVTRNEAARLLGSRRQALARSGLPPAGLEEASCRSASLDELLEIDAALARIADGTYGICEACGGAIGRDRLRALPAVRRCVGCSG